MAEARNAEDIHHETGDIPVRVPVAVVVITVLFVPICAALLWLYFDAMQEPPPTSLVFGAVSEREATAPPLLPNPAMNTPESIRRMEERLHSAGWIDRDAGIVHMPIDRAMERMVERGLTDDLFPLPSREDSGAGTDKTSDKGPNKESRQ